MQVLDVEQELQDAAGADGQGGDAGIGNLISRLWPPSSSLDQKEWCRAGAAEQGAGATGLGAGAAG